MPSVRCTIVELCAFKRTENGPLYLILKRSPNESLYPDLWQIVTGRIRKGETAKAAALRELREETRLSPERTWIAPVVGSFFNLADDCVEMCPLFAVEVASGAEPVLSKEHREYEWASFERAEALLVWPGHHDAVRVVRDYIVTESEAARLTEIKQGSKERKKK